MKNFINRELSWLEFNQRVIEEAQDNSNPLFERLKFLSISNSNLDEFFMVRVAALKDQMIAGFNEPDFAGLTPAEQIKKISVRVHQMVEEQHNCFNRSLVPALKKEEIIFVKKEKLTGSQIKFINTYFINNIYPVITPMVVDKGRPFPLILNKSLNIAVLLENSNRDEEPIFAIVQVPSIISRVLELPLEVGCRSFVYLEDIIELNLEKLFNGHNILAASCFRITRNADLSIDEEEAEDLLQAIKESVKQRKWGAAIRLDVESTIDQRLIAILKDELDIGTSSIYKILGPLDLSFLAKFSGLKGFDKYRFPKLEVKNSFNFEEQNIFDIIKEKDILLHHPYESFNSVVQLVQEAARDPEVLAIKQTLYRVSGNSPIVKALVQAAENGKQVTVLVELKARFDEENNIQWANRLEKAGCHVIYGLIGLKTHCKILLIVRSEEDGIKRYVHLATGNYNDVTANFYTDIGIFTCNPYYGADASALFNTLSGYSELENPYKFAVAPISLRIKFLELINREKENKLLGKESRIIAKVNSLVDEEIIEALYEASKAGVEIELIVRGMCCLRPGVTGLSENINVRSIVGRFLEHSRIYYFLNDGNEEIYLSSADWMTRNLDRRVELLFPVEEPSNKARLLEILKIHLRDTVKARILNKNGEYTRIDKRGKELLNCQQYFSDPLK
ncbi:MAG: RNA degradosome polyphosphate kinase [Clostridiaceae bacterium]|nr:RNA degradosome polyphosphate kinase [Clostridiaceae bacterium]